MHFKVKKIKRKPSLIVAVTADVADGHQICGRTLGEAHFVCKETNFHIQHDNFGFEKKSVIWVPKLLNDNQKQERMRTCTELLATVYRRPKAMLDNIVIMGKSAVSFHTTETKQQSKR